MATSPCAQQSHSAQGEPFVAGETAHEPHTVVHVTPSQYDCIVYPARMDELLRIRAGPGSGKTFTVVARIAQLLKDGASPDEILVLSMANKSVDSLRESLLNLVGSAVATRVEVATFHSFCHGLLEQYGAGVLPKYTKGKAFDSKTWKIITRLFSSKHLNLKGSTIGGTITPTRFGTILSLVFAGKTSPAEAAAQYNISKNYIEGVVEHLSNNGYVRYEELVEMAIDMVSRAQTRPDAAELIPRLARYKYVMVDEFQDIYPLLVRIIDAIVSYPTIDSDKGKKHLTICGDPNQSIYEFLGSYHGDMDSLQERIGGYHIHDMHIGESFRCTQQILDASTTVCLGERGLTSVRSHTLGKPVVLSASSEMQERQQVADEIVRLVCLSGGMLRFNDFAILTRSNDSALGMQSLLKTSYQIPSVKLSSGNLWIETELQLYKDVLSVLAGNADSSFAMMSVMQHIDPNRGGNQRAAKIFSSSMQAVNDDAMFLETHLYDELAKIGQGKGSYIKGVYRSYPEVLQTLVDFLNLVQAERSYISEMHQQNSQSYGPVELVQTLARISKVIGTPRPHASASANARKATSREALESLNNSLHHSFSKYVRNDTSAVSFLDYFLQTCDSEVPDDTSNSVQISTIHSAKGLEFPVVFVLGQSKFTSSWDTILAANTTKAKASVQEGHEVSTANARLLYVALTRARNLVYVGCRARYEELSHTARQWFTRVLPDLRAPANDTEDSSRKETQVYIQEGSMQDEGSASESKSVRGSSCQNWQHGTILQVLGADLHRGVPSQRKLEMGTRCYERFSRMRDQSRPIQISQGASVRFPRQVRHLSFALRPVRVWRTLACLTH